MDISAVGHEPRSAPTSDSLRSLYICALVVFLGAAALTLSSSRMMSAVMPMPGGWTMGMAWMRMPGQGWRGAVGLGVHHGLFCTGCCWALMLMQLVMGVMNLGAMVLVAAVIALEKLVARGELIARIVGIASLLAGMLTLARGQFLRF